jgi:hypothetical protein
MAGHKFPKPSIKYSPGIQEKETLLHLAAAYSKCDDKGQELQHNLVKRLFAWSPEAIKATDSEGRSPYLHRVLGSSEARSHQDKITFFLKDQIMHQQEECDSILDLLYGRPVSSQALGSSQDPQRTRIRQREREIHIDLREIQLSAPSLSRKDELISFIKSLQFEDILQYVQIPQHPFRSPAVSRQVSEVADIKPVKEGTGRRDFEAIFNALHKSGVRKILRLMVDDDESCPHQDELIESLGNQFQIEDFQWRKMDISSIVLRHASPHARKLHLFCSGNHSVLRDWSSKDGLSQLALVSQMPTNCRMVSLSFR